MLAVNLVSSVCAATCACTAASKRYNASIYDREDTEASEPRNFVGHWFDAAVVRWPITGVDDSADGDGIILSSTSRASRSPDVNQSPMSSYGEAQVRGAIGSDRWSDKQYEAATKVGVPVSFRMPHQIQKSYAQWHSYNSLAG